MAAPAFSLEGPGGSDPLEHISQLEQRARPTEGDLLYAAHLLRSRILERTARGVDVNGSAFAPYSERGPYYLYQYGPQGLGGRTTGGSRVKNLRGKGTATPYGVRYENYAAAKEAFGRSNVDLFGLVSHIHMLNSMLVRVGSQTLGSEQQPGDENSNLAPAESVELGFYGPEAERAKANNEGVASRNLARRNFFAANEQDISLMEESLAERASLRLHSFA